MFQQDQDIKTLIPLAESVMRDIVDGYRAKFAVVVGELKHDVLKQKEVRDEEIKLYRRCIDEASQNLDLESIVRVQDFQRSKKRVRSL